MATIKEKRVGFIGLGTMGSRMAQRLLATGYPLTVYTGHGQKPNRLPRRAPPSQRRPERSPLAVSTL